MILRRRIEALEGQNAADSLTLLAARQVHEITTAVANDPIAREQWDAIAQRVADATLAAEADILADAELRLAWERFTAAYDRLIAEKHNPGATDGS